MPVACPKKVKDGQARLIQGVPSSTEAHLSVVYQFEICRPWGKPWLC
jgi:hypothetical protein